MGATVFGVVLAGLMFGISPVLDISKGSPKEGYLIISVLARLGLFILFAWLSQITRTVGPFGSGVRVTIRAVTAALRKHYIKMPWLAYVRPNRGQLYPHDPPLYWTLQHSRSVPMQRS